MAWDGIERRKNSRGFCDAHLGLTNSLTKIECAVVNIEKGITESINFKTAVVGVAVTIVVMIFIQIATFAFLYGKLVNQVEINSGRLAKIENIVLVR